MLQVYYIYLDTMLLDSPGDNHPNQVSKASAKVDAILTY
jgi:hypothetical protein